MSWNSDSSRITPVLDVKSLAKVSITLGEGEQPRRPLRIQYRLVAPLPKGQEALIVRGDPSTERSIRLSTTVSRDRRTVTAATDHLSDFSLWVGQLTESIAAVFSTRGEAPECFNLNTPSWVSDVVIPDQQYDPPLRACTTRDPKNKDILVVKITNNRPSGLTITSNVDWVWRWQDAPGLIKFTMNDWLSNVSDPEAKRTIFVMPGQQLHLGFRRPANPVETNVVLTGSVSGSALGYGIAWQALEALDVPKGARTAIAGAMAAVCLIDAVGEPLQAAEAVDIAPIIGNLAQCVISNYDDILRVARSALTPDAYAQLAPRTPSLHKGLLRSLNLIGTVVDGGFQVAELISSIGLAQSARTITAFTKADELPSLKTIEPGRLGPLRVGMSSSEARGAGLVQRPRDAICGVRWEARPLLQRQGIHVDFRAGDPDDLDGIDVVQFDGEPVPKIKTAEDVGIGTSEKVLKRTYGNRIARSNFQGEGGKYVAYVLFGPSGALMFNMGSTYENNPDTVWAMHAVKGSTMTDLESSPGGC